MECTKLNSCMKGLFEWLKKLIQSALVEEFLVEIWFSVPTTSLAGTNVIKIKKEFRLGGISEISQTHIKGKTLNGGKFELKTTEIFDYNIIQLK